ncbi:unnamed protein product [Darwinula stevensoni]|uniref:LRAT domain-containing protein n=1 Tax=Darwinula stevensoni TaxID=69355 RepID=A0A7R9FT91_9CRUS|nr:unnamed protein product [Darwinula stevensoni]CAG0904210.1 unnamed protein product [Darwinula stevensoni]
MGQRPTCFREIIQNSWKFLMENLDVDRVAVRLYGEGILTSGDFVAIMTRKDPTERKVILLAKLSLRIVPGNIQKFFEVLEMEEQRAACDELHKAWMAIEGGEDKAFQLQASNGTTGNRCTQTTMKQNPSTMTMAEEEIKTESEVYKVDHHDEFVSKLKLGDIICTNLRENFPKLYHAGIYCGPRKGAHPVLMEFLKLDLNLVCPDCNQDLVLKDCDHNVHIVADLTYIDDGAGGLAVLGPLASSRKRTSNSQTKFGLSVLKCFMKDAGAFKFNFLDKGGKKVGEGKDPLAIDEILRRALKAVTDPSYRKEYDLLSFNCEHFASWCRYGEKSSLQVEKFVQSLKAAGSIIFAMITIFLVATKGGTPNKKQKPDD